MPYFEYKLVSVLDEHSFNHLGKEGWELVCIQTITSDLGLTSSVAFFKRPLQGVG